MTQGPVFIINDPSRIVTVVNIWTFYKEPWTRKKYLELQGNYKNSVSKRTKWKAMVFIVLWTIVFFSLVVAFTLWAHSLNQSVGSIGLLFGIVHALVSLEIWGRIYKEPWQIPNRKR